MGSQQLYSLSWGEFGSSFASTVQVLRGQNEMMDVTLAAGGRIFTAHKLVLSAASPLLMELLKVLFVIMNSFLKVIKYMYVPYHNLRDLCSIS